MVTQNNELNLRFFLEYLEVVIEHMDNGSFVCESLIKCFMSNQQILEQIYKIYIKSSDFAENDNVILQVKNKGSLFI